MKLNDKTYNVIKWVVLTVMPALSVLVGALGNGYGWDTDTVILTINAVALFLGAVTGVSNYQYNKEDSTDGNDQ